jgi:hypothetical protein
MFSLLPLPVTPIRPGSALLPPPPETAPKSEPLPALGPVTQPELKDPGLTATGASAVTLSATLWSRAGRLEPLGDARTLGPEATTAPLSSDIQMRASAARAMVQDQATSAQATPDPAPPSSALDLVQRQLVTPTRDYIPRDPAPEPRLILTR